MLSELNVFPRVSVCGRFDCIFHEFLEKLFIQKTGCTKTVKWTMKYCIETLTTMLNVFFTTCIFTVPTFTFTASTIRHQNRLPSHVNRFPYNG